jgi:uncharacterized cupin superfamily protein
VPNIDEPAQGTVDGLRVHRVAEAAGAEHLGASVYELAPGDAMVFHYHLQREELLIVLHGSLSLRDASGRRDLQQGDVVSFPRGPRGAHGYENRSSEVVRVLVVSEQNAPNVSVYPDSNRVGIFDAARRAERRFGALFDLDSALGGYGGGEPVASPEDAERRPTPE